MGFIFPFFLDIIISTFCSQYSRNFDRWKLRIKQEIGLIILIFFIFNWIISGLID